MRRPAEREGTERRVLRNTAYRSFGDLGSKLATLALFVVMARVLGDAEYGVYVFALSLVTLVTVLAELGQDTILAREVARDRGRADAMFANTVALRLLLSLPMLLVAVGAAAALGTAGHTRVVVLLVGLGFIVDLLLMVCFAVYQGHERLDLIAVVLVSQRWVTTIVAAAALVAGGGVVTVAVVYLAGAAGALLLALALMTRQLVRPTLHLEPRTWWPLMRAALPVGLAGVFFSILFRVDAAMLGILQSEEAVGLYGAAYRLLESSSFVGWSVGAALLPVLSRLSGHGAPRARVVFERGLKLAIALALPLTVAVVVLASPLIVLLYGDGFAQATTALKLLAPAMTLLPVSILAGYLLVSQDRQRMLAVVYGVVAAENVALNLVLIPRFSLDGAALGTSISQLLVVAGLLVLARGIVGPVGWTRVLAGPVLAAATSAVAMSALADHLGLALAIGGLVYVSCLLAFESLVYPQDTAAVRAFVRRRSVDAGARA